MNEKTDSNQGAKNLVDRFKDFNLRVYPITPDGNCLFRAISHQIFGTEDYHKQIRLECVNYIERERKYFQNFVFDEKFESYVQRMKKDKTWGDHLELQALSEIYQARIEVFYQSEIPIIIYSVKGKTESIFRLYYKNLNHYDSIIEIEQNPAFDPLELLLEQSRQRMTENNAIISRRNSKETTGLSTRELIERTLSQSDKEVTNKSQGLNGPQSLIDITEKPQSSQDIDLNKDSLNIYQKLLDMGFSLKVAMTEQLKFQGKNIPFDQILDEACKENSTS